MNATKIFFELVDGLGIRLQPSYQNEMKSSHEYFFHRSIKFKNRKTIIVQNLRIDRQDNFSINGILIARSFIVDDTVVYSGKAI